MIEEYRKFCSGCGACEKLCPMNAIKMEKDEKGFLYPIVNYEKCIKCGLCKEKCPTNNKEVEKEKNAYAAYNKDEIIRGKSSSGGIFTILAEYVIEKNGVVCGATFDENHFVEHIFVENKNDLNKLRSSKYVQSNLNNSFEKAKEYLEKGKLVYFSGTPCQIEGLKAYLLKEYDNLITQDLICHGAPSPVVWEEYLKYKNKKIKEVDFRNKEKSTWGEYNLKFTYDNSIEYINHNDDIFMKLFLKDLILRESCYQCKFKKKNRISDITLADFWGINNIDKSLNDGKGTSLVILNSEKGKKILDEVSDKMIKKEVEFEKAIQYNQSMVKSANKSKENDEITNLIKQGKFFEIFEGVK